MPGEFGWRDALQAFLDESGPALNEMPDADRDFLIRRGPLSLAMAGFYESLRDDITTDFPAGEIERLLEAGAPVSAVAGDGRHNSKLREHEGSDFRDASADEYNSGVLVREEMDD